MAQPYRAHLPGGIVIEATGELIYADDPADAAQWKIYEAWLAEQPGPDVPGGPVPPGTGLLPYIVPVLLPTQARAEMLARLDALVSDKRAWGMVNAAGHAWRLTDSFVLALTVHAAAFPPVPPGFTLPNAARVQVALTFADFQALLSAVSDRLIAVEANRAALVVAIDAAADPLSINLSSGWPA